jgi:hypothetical protein
MPNSYIHIQAAAQIMERLKAGVPAASPLSQAQADDFYLAAHTHRNYFAAGAYGPDLFVLLPDFLADKGKILRKVVDFVLTTWKAFDDDFYSHWQTWMGPVLDDASSLANGITGGMLGEISTVLNALSGSLLTFELGLAGQMNDIFGLFTSGTQTGYDDKSFFWSDMFHYRKTYAFARTLYQNALLAQTPDLAAKQKAFALGWITHCAVDVAGHPFVNAKCGGPYRTHWTRHHLIENHMDAFVYQQKFPVPDVPYGSLVTSGAASALAFQPGTDPALSDEPSPYDYFPSQWAQSHPPYPDGESAADKAARRKIFDVTTEPLPDHLCELLRKTMQDVYTGPKDQDGPQVLRWDNPSGRPTAQMLKDMYQLVFDYMKYTTTSGFSPSEPKPPDVITDHSLPTPPGGPVDSGGADPAAGKSFNFLDLLLAIIASAIWLAELATWVATILPGLLTDLGTWPLRELLYQLLVVPAWDLYMRCRSLLVLEGFLIPRPSEISRGLVLLGADEKGPLQQLRADLDDPTGFAAPGALTEPSGLDSTRGATTQGFSLDPAYPRAMVTDLDPPWSALVLPDFNTVPSEFVAPWRYPDDNMAGMRMGWEAPRTHVGPYLQGQDASALLGQMPGSDAARQAFEAAATPEATERASAQLLPTPGGHLGDPVDYGVYLVGQLTGHDAAQPLPDFNLDGDRGYGYHCWDYLRRAASKPPAPRTQLDQAYPDQWRCAPQLFTALTGKQPPQVIDAMYGYWEPCTVPERYDPADNPHHRSAYDPLKRIVLQYLRQAVPPASGSGGIDLQVSEQEMQAVGISPTGRKV